jgi:Ca2+-binding RTX toxin-like protein
LVTFAGTAESFAGTSGNDTFIDNTTIPTLTLDGGLGDDDYILQPGSTIAITDAGGIDNLDFGSNGQAITADVGTTSSNVTDLDGLVTFAGTAEGVTGTGGNDTFIDNTTIPLVNFDGGLGNDTYKLQPGSTIGITDAGGIDTLDFGSNGQAITADMGTTSSTVIDLDGLVTFSGTAETVYGTNGNDTFTDNGDVNYTFAGGGGNDTYDLQPGSTITVLETIGNDTILLGRAKHAVNANLATGVITDTAGNQVLITSGQVENVDGSGFNDTILGNASDNVLFGGPGNDVLNGGAGNDTYYMIAGGTDVINDSAGIDTLDFSRTTATGVNVDLGQSTGSVQTIAAGAALAITGNLERLIGTNKADSLSGAGLDEILVGLGGNDVLQGQSGNDVLLGGDGDDDLNGGADRDILVGGTGADRLKGVSGEDILIAGTTAYDATQVDLAAWSALQGVWVGPGAVAARVGAIRSGVGPQGYRLLASGPNQTVFDDGAADTLTGGQSTDWYFASSNDTITDKDNTEFFNDLPPV